MNMKNYFNAHLDALNGQYEKLIRQKNKMKTLIPTLFLSCLFYTSNAVTLDIVACGGVPDGRTDNTAIIQRAINACSEQTGSIVFPDGNPNHLKSSFMAL
jgi:hypothetical protein